MVQMLDTFVVHFGAESKNYSKNKYIKIIQ